MTRGRKRFTEPSALTWDTVREIGLTLPNATAGTAWRSPTLEVNGCGWRIASSARSPGSAAREVALAAGSAASPS